MAPTPTHPLVVFDLDGTLIAGHEPVWKRLHEGAGSDPARRKAALRAGLSGAITYDAWFAEDVAMLRDAGATRARLVDVLSGMTPTPGARRLVEDLRAGGAKVAVLSGGVTLALETVLAGLEFDAVHANRLEFDGAGALVGGTATRYDLHRKVEGLRDLAGRFQVPLRGVAFVGDGANDVDVARAAGLSVAWAQADEGLRYVAHHHVPGPHMDALRPLLFEQAD